MMPAKKAFLYFFILTAAILSLIQLDCSDSIQNASGDNYWAGTIPGWTLGERNIEGHVMTSQYDFIAARGTIEPAGNFSVRFTTPPDSLLSLFTSIPPICHSSLVIDPPGIKYAAVILYVVSDSAVLGEINKSNRDSICTGMYIMNTMYVSGSAALDGMIWCYSDTVKYNWNADAGWNAPVVYYKRISSSGNTVMISNNEPPGLLSWRFRQY
jgi:hypothetical protein